MMPPIQQRHRVALLFIFHARPDCNWLDKTFRTAFTNFNPFPRMGF